MRIKCIRQSPSMCGPASLAAMLAFYGIQKSEKELEELSGATKAHGTPPSALVRVLKKFNLKPRSRSNGSWSALKRITAQGRPILVNWWSDYAKPADGHYSVVYRVTDASIYMMDPEIGGYRRMSKRRFMKFWYDFESKSKKPIKRWFVYSGAEPRSS